MTDSVRRPCPPLAAFLLIGLCITALVPAARGQFPPDLVRSTGPLSPSQRDQLSGIVANLRTDLGGEDVKVAASARKRIMATLIDRRPGRGFHVALDAEMTPLLTQMAADSGLPVRVRINALHLLGTMATDRSVDAVTVMLDSDVDSLRYSAAQAYQRSFEAVSAGRNLFNDSQRVPVMTRLLRDKIGTESRSYVLYALVRACDASPLPSNAIDGICQGLRTQFSDAYTQGPSDRIDRLAASLQIVLNRYIQHSINEIGLRAVAPQQAALVETAVMGIRLALQHGQSRVPTKPAQKTAYANLVGTAENVLNVVCGVNPTDTDTSTAFATGDFVAAENALQGSWIGPNGPVYSHSAWGFRNGHFDHLFDQ